MSVLKRISSSIFCFAIAILYLYGSLLTRDNGASGEVFMSPRHFPIACSAMLIILGIWNMYHELKVTNNEMAKTNPKSLVISVSVLLLCTLLFKVLGGIICGTIFLATHFILLSQEERKQKTLVLMIIWALIASAVFSYLFRYGFGIRLTLYPTF